ncbi:MAG: hypothetical protein GEU79_05355 [Acidimicrobiia bacterium]|nr:hypothetical protein [Acidimicrobiia bacterium]
MKIGLMGVLVDTPPGWEVRVKRVEADVDSARRLAVTHAATIPLPAERGDFGSGIVERLGPDDVFVALLEYGEEVVGSNLFAARGFPRDVGADDFDTARLQVNLPGQAGFQRFFTVGDRAFCLYVVIGAYRNRARLARKVRDLMESVEVGARDE